MTTMTIRRLMAISLFGVAVAMSTDAVAGPVDLLPNPVDDDGRVTLGEIFQGAGAASDVVVAERPGPSVVIDAARLQSVARQSGLEWANPMGLRRVIVRAGLVDAMPAGSVSAQGAAHAVPDRAATVEVLIYARSLAAGEIIQPEDVVWSSVQSHQAAGGGPADAERVIGLSARRALRAGAPVATRDLASPQVIARNDAVEVAFVSGGVRLTVTGRATRNAAIGDPVPVVNATSGRTIDAVATGPGQAVAGPAARSQQFASR